MMSNGLSHCGPRRTNLHFSLRGDTHGTLRILLTLASSLFVALLCFSLPTSAQAPKGAGAAPAAATPSATPAPAAGGGLQGISFARDSWDKKLKRFPQPEDLGIHHAKDIIVLCYTLVPGNSASQPFLLESNPISSPQWQAERHYKIGDVVLPTRPNGHYYLAEADGRSSSHEPIFSTNGGIVKDGNAAWLDGGSTVWVKNHIYKNGDLVTPISDNGHYYRANPKGEQGTSGEHEPAFSASNSKSVLDSGIEWIDVGNLNSPTPNYCNSVNPSKPLLMNQILVLAIDMSGVPMDRFKILNLNLTNQQGAPLNPTPIRPSLSAGTATGAEVSGTFLYFDPGGLKSRPSEVYYLTWPNQLPGDTIATISVNLVYTPVAAALPWESNTFYPAGSVVIPPPSGGNPTINGHYYLARNGGISSDNLPDFDSAAVSVQRFLDGDGSSLSWKEVGPTSVYPVPPAWQAKTKYSRGSLVVPSPANGYYYEATADGTSSPSAPGFSNVLGSTSDESNSFGWTNKGLTSVNPLTTPTWAPGIAYAKGALVVPPNPPNGHYYEAQDGGVSGMTPPPFSIAPGGVVQDGGRLIWVDVGSTLPSSAKVLKIWTPGAPYSIGDTIENLDSGHYYSAVQAGISGANPPQFNLTAPKTVPATDSNITWQDLGTSLPASVASVGAQPSDLNVNLLTYTLPQVHALSYFNISSGVVFSSIKSVSFTPTGITAKPFQKVSGSPIIDPILALSVYLKPIDAERPFQKSNLIPAPTVAFSLSSPTTNFYLGGSSEFFFRNLQIVYGLSLSRVPTLLPDGQQLSATTPATRQVFAKGAFVGVSFNILGFIQSVF